MSDVKKRAIDLASYDALIHCISWMDIKKTLMDLLAECERLEKDNWAETLLDVQEQNQHLKQRITALEAENKRLEDTNQSLRRDIAELTPDIQESIVKKLGWLAQITTLESELEEIRSNLEFAYKRSKVLADLLNIPVHESPEVTGTILGLVRGSVERLIAERDAWKTAITVLTPNDADFTDDPHACAGYIRAKLNLGLTNHFAGAGKVMEGREKCTKLSCH